jgi:hypothetical protein
MAEAAFLLALIAFAFSAIALMRTLGPVESVFPPKRVEAEPIWQQTVAVPVPESPEAEAPKPPETWTPPIFLGRYSSTRSRRLAASLLRDEEAK